MTIKKTKNATALYQAKCEACGKKLKPVYSRSHAEACLAQHTISCKGNDWKE